MADFMEVVSFYFDSYFKPFFFFFFFLVDETLLL